MTDRENKEPKNKAMFVLRVVKELGRQEVYDRMNSKEKKDYLQGMTILLEKSEWDIEKFKELEEKNKKEIKEELFKKLGIGKKTDIGKGK